MSIYSPVNLSQYFQFRYKQKLIQTSNDENTSASLTGRLVIKINCQIKQRSSPIAICLAVKSNNCNLTCNYIKYFLKLFCTGNYSSKHPPHDRAKEKEIDNLRNLCRYSLRGCFLVDVSQKPF